LLGFLAQKGINRNLNSRQSLTSKRKFQDFKCFEVNNIDILKAKLEVMKEELPIRDKANPSKILKPYLNKDIKVGLIYEKKKHDQIELVELAKTNINLYNLYNKMMTALSSQNDFIMWFDLNFSKLSDLYKIIDVINNKTNSICPSCCSCKYYCPYCLYCLFFKLIGQLDRKVFFVLVKVDESEIENSVPKFIDITKLDEFERRINSLTANPCLVTNPFYQLKDLLKGYGRHLMKKNEGNYWIKEFKTTSFTYDDMCGVWYFTLFSLHDNFHYDISALIELYKLYLELYLHFNM
jgi:hypothetical protein